MGLLDEWSRRAAAGRREGRVEFLGEQTGFVEDTLKRDLILEFVTRPPVRRAYLVQVGAQPDAQPAVALCIVSDQANDHGLVRRVGEVFQRLFAKDAFLEVIFLSQEQEADLKKVSTPFYTRNL